MIVRLVLTLAAVACTSSGGKAIDSSTSLLATDSLLTTPASPPPPTRASTTPEKTPAAASKGVSATEAVRPPTPAHSYSRISLERKPCFGTCPVYVVRIDQSGQVDFSGRANVRHVGDATARISSEEFARIEAAVIAARLDALPTSFNAREAACGQYATDHAVVVFSATTTTGQTRTLRHDLGCMGAPRALGELYQLVDSIANTAQWIGQS